MLSSTITRILSLLVVVPCWSLDVSTGTFQWPTSTGNFRPIQNLPSQAKVLIVSHHLTSGSTGAYDRGIGIAVSGASVALYSRRGTSNGNALQRTDRIVHTMSSTTAVSHSGSVVEFGSNYIDLNAVTISTTYSLLVRWMTLGGSDLTNVSLVQYTSPTSTGNQELTGAGFAPDAVVVITNGLSCTPPCNDTTSIFHPGIGLAAKDGTMGSVGNYITLTNSEARRVQRTNRIITLPTTSDLRLEASVVSFDSDGITLNWQSVDSSVGLYFWVLYLRGPQATVASFNQRTSTGEYSYTGLSGFTPKGGLFTSFCAPASTGIETTGSFMVGLSDIGHAWAGIASSIGRSEGSSTLICRTASASPPPINSEASFVSWNSSGVTVNWTTADSTQRQFLVLLLGDAGAPPSGRRRVVIQ